MNHKRILHKCLHYSIQKYGTNTRLKVEGDTGISIINEIYQPKHHPGIVKPKTISLPPLLVQAILAIIQDYPMKLIVIDSDALTRHLKGRVPLIEIDKLSEIKQKVFEDILLNEKYISNKNSTDDSLFMQKIKDKMQYKLKKKVYNWSPINYNIYNSLLYLFARSTPEYAVLVKIFSEINSRDVNFKPKNMFDFGSGVGTATWAARLFWKDHIFEHFNVDVSADINDLAQRILQKEHNKASTLKGIFYRQFLPANNINYDIVVSAYSMLELPSFQVRLDTILKLWNKTNKYLVVVEQGTNAGFNVISQIRNFVLQLRDDKNTAHVFSPCPHDKSCPRLLNDSTPCNFEVRYIKPFVKETKMEKELYSYVILKKGRRNSKDDEWPRVVRETIVKSKHTICRMCSSNGNLTEMIFTASKHGKILYHCARATRWGDRLPLTSSTEMLFTSK